MLFIVFKNQFLRTDFKLFMINFHYEFLIDFIIPIYYFDFFHLTFLEYLNFIIHYTLEHYYLNLNSYLMLFITIIHFFHHRIKFLIIGFIILVKTFLNLINYP